MGKDYQNWPPSTYQAAGPLKWQDVQYQMYRIEFEGISDHPCRSVQTNSLAILPDEMTIDFFGLGNKLHAGYLEPNQANRTALEVVGRHAAARLQVQNDLKR